MFLHRQELQFKSTPEKPDAVHARKLQEVPGGQYGERPTSSTRVRTPLGNVAGAEHPGPFARWRGAGFGSSSPTAGSPSAPIRWAACASVSRSPFRV